MGLSKKYDCIYLRDYEQKSKIGLRSSCIQCLLIYLIDENNKRRYKIIYKYISMLVYNLLCTILMYTILSILLYICYIYNLALHYNYVTIKI